MRGLPGEGRQNGFLLFLLISLLCTTPCRAKTLWVVLLPGTSLSDWQRADAPHLHQLLATGSVALMNTRTARTPSDRVRETPASAALTLGAGSRAAGGLEVTDFRPLNSPLLPHVSAGELYARRTGLAPSVGSLVNVQWPRVLRENAAQGYDLHPGNLADALRREGVDMEARGGPLAFALASDSDGQATSVSAEAGTERTDRCIVWDMGGDLHAADARLSSLMGRMGSGRLMVLSPTASDTDYRRGARLCPVVVWGPDVPPGLIEPASTRRAGLVTDTDFAVTAAAWFGVPLKDFPVRPFGEQAWQYRPAANAVPQLVDLDTGALAQWDGLRALPYLALLLGFWVVGTTVMASRQPVPHWAASVPPALILAFLLSTSPMSLALWLAAALLSVPLMRPLWYSGAIAALLAGDMIVGDPLMRHGLLGYSAIEGARYYGIGNEAMGALVGTCLVVADVCRRRLSPRWGPWLWLGLAGIATLLGSPLAGAKAGGLIVALAAFGTYVWAQSGRRWDRRVAGLGVALIALLLLGVAFLDAHLNGARASHFGQAAARLGSGGFGEWMDIIRRKLAVEGRLLWHSTWAVPLWGGLASLVWLSRRLPLEGRPLLLAGLVAAAACLAVNDAGTVAASLCLALLWSGLVVLRQTKTPRPSH